MVNVKDKQCIHEKCNKQPSFNLPTKNNGIYCFEHKKPGMVNVKNKNCQQPYCKITATFGLLNKKSQYCNLHKISGMINIYLEAKCDVPECQNDYEFTINDQKFCLKHCPDKSYEIVLKRKCKYCDIEETSKYVCKDCLNVQNKKEWMIVRHIKRNIDALFIYNSNKMLQPESCSKKRPDVYYELNKHCVIVEIDENQHGSYENICECARINEIVNGIGGKSVILIRFNPDIIKNRRKQVIIPLIQRLELLIKIIKEELTRDYDTFNVKLIQLYYNDNYLKYEPIKIEDITKIVCV